MIRILKITMLCLLLCMVAVRSYAHPHVFVDGTVEFVFNDSGLTGARVVWVFDEMASTQYMTDLDLNGDGTFTAHEWDAQRDDIAGFLAEESFFMHILVNGWKMKIDKVEDFVATIEDGVLKYSFFAPFSVPQAVGTPSSVQVAVYDPSFYTDFYIPLAGVSAKGNSFPLTLDVDDAPDLAFYNGQVVPVAALLQF